MVGSMTPLPLLQKLRVSVSHKNLRIKAKAAVSLSKCVSKMVNEEMEEFGMEKLIEVAADLVNDRLPEARDAARSIATSVYEAIIKDFGMEKLIEVAADLVNDRLPEARDAARSIATSVYEAIIKDVEVEEKME
ncbi:hypothetical protein KIW84_043769, partial [Lathyrus oleraceus]